MRIDWIGPTYKQICPVLIKTPGEDYWKLIICKVNQQFSFEKSLHLVDILDVLIMLADFTYIIYIICINMSWVF